MHAHPLPPGDRHRVVAGLPFVEALARRLAASMPHSIDMGDLVQDGVLGLIDAARRFDQGRGIKFETFAERRVRGAMIDALRREAWPRGVRRVRRELEAAREQLRRELGYEPSLADLAARVGSDEKRLGRTIVRIHAIESTSPLAAGDHLDETALPQALVPSEPEAPDCAYERTETHDRIVAAIATLPPRERRLIGLYYFGEATMKQIGGELGVNESRVSQLHARAIQRLRQVLVPDMAPSAAGSASVTPNLLKAVLAFRPTPAKMSLHQAAGGWHHAAGNGQQAAVGTQPVNGQRAVPAPVNGNGSGKANGPTARLYSITSRTARSKSPSLNGFASQRQPLSSRKASASVPTTSPVTKITRRASNGLAAAMAR
jgi:RNA polymerase sigma factor for flagellar operon FliA